MVKVKSVRNLSLILQLLLRVLTLRQNLLVQRLLNVLTSVHLVSQLQQTLYRRKHLQTNLVSLNLLVKLVQKTNHVLRSHQVGLQKQLETLTEETHLQLIVDLLHLRQDQVADVRKYLLEVLRLTLHHELLQLRQLYSDRLLVRLTVSQRLQQLLVHTHTSVHVTLETLWNQTLTNKTVNHLVDLLLHGRSSPLPLSVLDPLLL